jgi:DNA-binding NtrC family response regulator
MNPTTQLDAIRSEPTRSVRIHDAVEHSVEPAGESLTIRSGLTVAEMEKSLILETLRSTDNNRTEAAKLLGISIRTLRNKLHEYRGDGIIVEGE